VAIGFQQEADIVVKVLGLGAPRGDQVNVDVEDCFRQWTYPGEAAFFFGFAKRHSQNVTVAISMAAKLQPFVELAVMSEQRMRAIVIEDPCGARHMADRESAFAAVFMRVHKLAKAREHRGFFFGERLMGS